MSLNNHKDLVVWQKSMQLVFLLYKAMRFLPKQEQFTLVSQILRSAVSIPSNIAEGFGRNYRLEFNRFLSISYASSCELETQLIIVSSVYPEVKLEEIFSLLTEIQRMLKSLMQKIKIPSS